MNKMKKRANWLVNISWKTSVVLKFLSTEIHFSEGGGGGGDKWFVVQEQLNSLLFIASKSRGSSSTSCKILHKEKSSKNKARCSWNFL